MALLFLGIVAIAVWIMVTFIAAVPNGWTHLPLGIGVVLIAVGLVEIEQRRQAHQERSEKP